MQSLRMQTEVCPQCAKSGRSSQLRVECGRKGPEPAEFCRCGAKRAQSSGGTGQTWANWASSTTCDQLCTDFEYLGPEVDQIVMLIRSESVVFVQNWPGLGRKWPDFDHVWPDVDQLRPEIGQIWATREADCELYRSVDWAAECTFN